MKILKAAMVIVIITLAGCGGPGLYWYNENNTYKQARKDCKECYNQAQRKVLDAVIQERRDYGSSIGIGDVYSQTLFEKCLKDKGYRQVWDYNLESDVKKRTIVLGESSHAATAGQPSFGTGGHMYHIAGN